VRRSHEYGSGIIHSLETGVPRVVYGNVANEHLIDNLPQGCCVEVPCLVDANGIQPTRIGALPPQLAALMQTNVNVQALTVEAALSGRREHVYHAAMLDPHTAAELDLDQIWSLVDDLIEAHGDWLPPFDAPTANPPPEGATMPKITLIGAGSAVFTRALCSDILLSPVLERSTISLMDIDAERLEQARALVQALVDGRGLAATVEATTDRREAVRGADYVVTTFQQGGLEAYALDIEIPRRFGVEQCVGDTLGPGGVFRSLRTIPVLLDLCDEMDELAPDALLLNYVNPMAANCWAVAAATGRPHVGLCHSVQGTSEMLARWIDVPIEEVTYRCAGINHQAFYLEFRRGAEDLYPASARRSSARRWSPRSRCGSTS
jgi:alpha-galactosidase/6-phospho-beta-glucosidase family protein